LSSTAEKHRNIESIEPIKTIEIDVANELSPEWYSLPQIKETCKNSQTILREVMKNYFVFLDFIKKLEDFGSRLQDKG